MQGKLIIAVLLSALPSAAIAAEPQRRQGCPRAELPQQKQLPAQQQQQRRKSPQGCPVIRSIPAVVDPTPVFIL
jgi:hypothetical protein